MAHERLQHVCTIPRDVRHSLLTLKDPETERTEKQCRALVTLFLCHRNTVPLCSSVKAAQGPHPALFFDLATLMYVYAFVCVCVRADVRVHVWCPRASKHRNSKVLQK